MYLNNEMLTYKSESDYLKDLYENEIEFTENVYLNERCAKMNSYRFFFSLGSRHHICTTVSKLKLYIQKQKSSLCWKYLCFQFWNQLSLRIQKLYLFAQLGQELAKILLVKEKVK